MPYPLGHGATCAAVHVKTLVAHARATRESAGLYLFSRIVAVDSRAFILESWGRRKSGWDPASLFVFSSGSFAHAHMRRLEDDLWMQSEMLEEHFTARARM